MKMTKKIILILSIVTTNYFAQDTLKSDLHAFQKGVTISYSHQEVQFMSIGGILSKNYGHPKGQGFATGICMDVALNSKIFTLAPRMFVEGKTDYFGMRLNFINYLRGTDNNFRIVPEVIFNYLGILNLGVGYSFEFGGKSFDDISLYRVTITYNFIK